MRTELIHPMVVHFPIVLIFCMLAIDALAASMRIPVSGRGTVAIVSTSVAVAAGVFALLAFAFGDLAYDIAAEMANAPRQALELHEEVDVACWAEVGSKHRTEHGQPPDRVSTRKRIEDVVVHLDPRSQLHPPIIADGVRDSPEFQSAGSNLAHSLGD